jgi:hypothetical protein
MDADYKHALEDLLKLQYHLWQDGVELALEMSKRGGHLWILLETPLLASEFESTFMISPDGWAAGQGGGTGGRDRGFSQT